ncbi:hypothetical protein C8J56DRAFT_1163751 [Mycena floridula]|nr:hypothetical protein C8J56DRAFT_1163751 [Mycena floridula]
MASYNEAAIKSLQLWHITHYGYVAAEVFVVVDILLTLDLEVHLVWPRRASPGKILFLLNRYLPPVNMAVDLYFWFGDSPPLRLYAFHAFDYVRAKTPGAAARYIILSPVFLSFSTRRWSKLFWPLKPMRCIKPAGPYTFYGNLLLPGIGCVSDCTGKICNFSLVTYLVQFAGFDTMVVWLTAWRAYTVSRARREIVRDSPVDQMYPYSGFLRLLFRDGLIYYSCILIAAVLNILTILIAPWELHLFSTNMSQALSTVACSR